MRQFEERVGRAVPVAHFFIREGEPFPDPEQIGLTDRGKDSSVLFFNVKPQWIAPDKTLTWAAVADGKADSYLDRIVDSIALLNQPMFLTVHHEPEDDVIPTLGSGYTAGDYAKMYRHVADYIDGSLRERGVAAASRPIWVWDVTGYPRWESMWDELYPGEDIVDWIAYAPYLDEPLGCDFSCLANRTYPQYPDWTGFYDWALQNHPNTPLMLGEWGVQESALADGASAKSELFRTTPSILAESFPQLRALIYFNDSKPPSDPSASRIDTSPQSLAGFQEMVDNVYLRQSSQ